MIRPKTFYSYVWNPVLAMECKIIQVSNIAGSSDIVTGKCVVWLGNEGGRGHSLDRRGRCDGKGKG